MTTPGPSVGNRRGVPKEQGGTQDHTFQFSFALHSQAVRIAHLDPDRARTGSIGAVDLLGDDARGAEPASVGENDRTILSHVFVEEDASTGVAQQPRQRSFAVQRERRLLSISGCSATRSRGDT